MYKRGAGNATVILGVYVDDLLITGSETQEIEKFKKQMAAEFEMCDLGLLSYYLGIEVEQHEDFITLKLSGYAKKVLAKLVWRIAILPKFPWTLVLDCMKTRKVKELMHQSTEA